MRLRGHAGGCASTFGGAKGGEGVSTRLPASVKGALRVAQGVGGGVGEGARFEPSTAPPRGLPLVVPGVVAADAIRTSDRTEQGGVGGATQFEPTTGATFEPTTLPTEHAVSAGIQGVSALEPLVQKDSGASDGRSNLQPITEQAFEPLTSKGSGDSTPQPERPWRRLPELPATPSFSSRVLSTRIVGAPSRTPGADRVGTVSRGRADLVPCPVCGHTTTRDVVERRAHARRWGRVDGRPVLVNCAGEVIP